jgi:hypothetical protein
VSISRLPSAALLALSLVLAGNSASAQGIERLSIVRVEPVGLVRIESVQPAHAVPLHATPGREPLGIAVPLPLAPFTGIVPPPSPPLAAGGDDDAGRPHTHFKTRFALGFVSSILAHEAGHVIASYAVGGRPSFGFDKGRPTIYSGIDSNLEPHKQFIFSSAGLTVQTLMDELILDIPHHRGGAFERGLLAGGIATTAFYITIGRSASVSDVTFMARTSSLSKTEVSLIFGAIAASHVLRIHYDDHYAHFFAAPTERGALKVGMLVK